MSAAVEDALDGMSREQLVKLDGAIKRRLEGCFACGGEMAVFFRVRGVAADNHRVGLLPICLPCFEKNRKALPKRYRDTQLE